jgi:hypothetical protein
MLPKAMHFAISVANRLGYDIDSALLGQVIFFAEFLGVYQAGLPFLGVKIVKAPFGPAPDGHQRALGSLIESGRVVRGDGALRALTDPEPSLLTVRQKKVLAEVTKELCANFFVKTISKFTLRSLVWQKAEMGQELPVALYFTYPIEPTPEELSEARRWAEENGIPDGLEAFND